MKDEERTKECSFFSTCAHELRTPLTKIIGFSEVLLERKLDQQRNNRFLKIIHEKALGLADLFNELLVFIFDTEFAKKLIHPTANFENILL